MEGGEIWECFSRGLIIPIFKKGNPADIENYRGISFCNAISNVMATGTVLNDRLNEWVRVHWILSDFQSGFRKGYSTADNLFCLFNLVKIKWFERRTYEKVYCFFVDFKAAFDRINRSACFYKLSRKEVSWKFFNVACAAVWNGAE